jgi:Family of unknown function (DUF6281)
LAAAGCRGEVESGGDVQSGDASCALTVRFDGAVYEGHGVEVGPREGEPVGTGVLPACGDEDDEEIELAEIEGVSPDVALSWPGRWDIVLVRRGVELPPEVERLRQAPICKPRDARVELSGPWDGILGVDGKTELDLDPPYDVYVIVDEASAPRYERAYLTVRVPPSLGRPITRDDVQASLWEGGTIALRARCSRDGGFVAEDVAAFAPA